MSEKPTIVIKKIKKGGHGAHGGAWKVAYADFVTAMMAFFLLLWLLSAVPKENLSGVADYFTPTVGLKDKAGMGFDGGKSESKEGEEEVQRSEALVYGAPQSGAVVKAPTDPSVSTEANDEKNFTAMQQDISKAVHDNPELKVYENHVIIDMTPEGLRIQIVDNQNKAMFKPGTSQMEPFMETLLSKLSEVIKYMPNYISITGHTNSTSSSDQAYDNWSLSAERANVTRKFLGNGHIDQEQIARIVGKADQEPLSPDNPEDIRNIRISLVLMKNSIMPYQKRTITEDALNGKEIGPRNKFRKPVVTEIK